MLVAKNVVRLCTEAIGAPGSDVTYQPRLYARWEITSPRCQPTEIAYRRGTGVIGLARRDGEAGTHVGKRHGGGGPRGSAGLGLRPLTARNSGELLIMSTMAQCQGLPLTLRLPRPVPYLSKACRGSLWYPSCCVVLSSAPRPSNILPCPAGPPCLPFTVHENNKIIKMQISVRRINC